MLGSIIGDIVGSTFEVENHRSKFFELFRNDARFTDDTILVVAVSDILLNWENIPQENRKDYIYKTLRSWCALFLNRGFGSLFNQWIISGKDQPYNSYGNNSLARISPLIIYSKNKKLSLEKTLEIGKEITEVTHNTLEAINAVSCYLEIAYRINNEDVKNFKEIITDTLKKYDLYDLKSLEELQVSLDYDVTAKTTLLVVASALLNSNDFEDCIRNIVSVGGDTDTYCSVGGALAEIIWGIEQDYLQKMELYFKRQDKELLKIVNNVYGLA
jgi:ADP-ribosyl-[dinitrogen reductase] hydrolase